MLGCGGLGESVPVVHGGGSIQVRISFSCISTQINIPRVRHIKSSLAASDRHRGTIYECAPGADLGGLVEHERRSQFA
jgi:hypothetical protein